MESLYQEEENKSWHRLTKLISGELSYQCEERVKERTSEHSLTQQENAEDKFNKAPKDVYRRSCLIPCAPRLKKLELLIQRYKYNLLDRWIHIIRVLKSLVIIYLREIKLEKRKRNSSLCQKWHWLFIRAVRSFGP